MENIAEDWNKYLVHEGYNGYEKDIEVLANAINYRIGNTGGTGKGGNG